MKIAEFARQYGEQRGVCVDHAKTLISRARSLGNHVGRDELSACFREDVFNRWLAVLSERVAPATLRGYRSDGLTLWLAASDLGYVPPPRRRLIRPAKVPDLPIDCYSVDEVRLLVAHADDYFAAVIRVGWDSGLRRGDVWRLQRSVIRVDPSIVIQHKTGRRVLCSFRESTVAAVSVLPGPLPLRWRRSKHTWWARWHALVDRSGVGRGTYKWLRRASGSHVEAEHPGQGHRKLGHQSPGVFDRHYDARLGEASFLPPEL